MSLSTSSLPDAAAIPPFQVSVRHVDDQPWVELVGSLDWATCSIMRNVLAPFYRPGAVVTLDMFGVVELSPAAERTLFSAQRRLAALGGQLVLWRLRGQAARGSSGYRIARIMRTAEAARPS